jgi:proteasome assembly chaperone (PAC2) family protein
MTEIEWLEKPQLRDPVAVLAFEGWNDAADASTGTVEHLIATYCDGPFAKLDLENYMNYQMSRPIISIDTDMRELHWPATGFFGIQLADHDHDLIAVLGEEPHLRWPSFCRQIITTLRDLGVSKAVSFGAFIGQVPHTLPVPIFGVSTDDDFITRLGVNRSSYEGPTGITGVIHAALAADGFDASSLWAAVPHYLAANPSPKCMLALLAKLSEVIGYEFETSKLDEEAVEYDQRVGRAVEESADFLAYVRQLEESSGGAETSPADSDQLVEEIERFLRDSS